MMDIFRVCMRCSYEMNNSDHTGILSRGSAKLKPVFTFVDSKEAWRLQSQYSRSFVPQETVLTGLLAEALASLDQSAMAEVICNNSREESGSICCCCFHQKSHPTHSWTF